MSATSEPAVSPPFTQSREFWVLMGYAVALGVFGAFAGLVFMGVIGFGGRLYVDANPVAHIGHIGINRPKARRFRRSRARRHVRR